MDSFRQVFVKQIEVVITKKPSKQVLLELLKITSPQLTIQDVDNEWSRNNAFNILANWMHTGIHPDTSSRALQDLQNVQDFFQNCCRTFLDQENIEHITNKTHYWSEENHVRSAIVATFTDMNFVEKVRSPRSTNMPLEFHVRDNWPQIDFHRQTWEDEMTPKVLATLTSYSCINARGAIAHGQQTELCYSFKNANMLKACTVKEIFDAHGGTKQLESIAAIKHELINNGPVVSVSFILTKEFIESNMVDASVFNKSRRKAS